MRSSQKFYFCRTCAMADEKLTKKQQKALEFKNKKKRPLEEADADGKASEKEPVNSPDKISENSEEPKKKRKTRRGKKGKGANSGPRFILFVGNLSYKVTEADLRQYFKSSKPDVIRLRPDKGIGFLEFTDEGRKEHSKKDNEENLKDEEEKDKGHSSMRSRMDFALSKHHTIFQDRKINVELTAGGGGNSKVRLEKIKEKNEKLGQEKKVKIAKQESKKKSKPDQKSGTTAESSTEAVGGIHPSRLNRVGK